MAHGNHQATPTPLCDLICTHGAMVVAPCDSDVLAHLNIDLTSHARPQKAARELVRAVSVGIASDERVDDIVLVTDELVGNARQHSAIGGPIAMTVDRYAWGLVVKVTDSSRAMAPELRRPDGEREHGRGLYIVNALATAWNVRPGGHGKTVQAAFANMSAGG
ncbi:ATP-binding protein [Streptomyces sp. NPDC005386]|uniref:ATP-binding protein n=1 Tax=Streptomyces sp. NPDC005386 TaxID=3154562 RepID=UPI0033B32A99